MADNPHFLEKEIHGEFDSSIIATGFDERITGLSNDYPTGDPKNLHSFEKIIHEHERKLRQSNLEKLIKGTATAGSRTYSVSDFFAKSKNPITVFFPGATAAYSLRDLMGNDGSTKVIRVRRYGPDNAEKDFTASEVSDGSLEDWVNVGNDYVGYARFQNTATANVILSSSFTLEATKSWSIKFGYIRGTEYGTPGFLGTGLFGNSAFDNGGFWVAGSLLIITDDSDFLQTINMGSLGFFNVGQHYEIEFFNTPSEGVRAKIDGTTMTTLPKICGDITIDRIGLSKGITGERVIHNVRVDLNGDGTLDYSYAGDGNQASNWVDRVGSNDGTPGAEVLTYNNDYTSGYVSIWYDQSGNGYDAREPTREYQPLIVENGSIVTDTNGKVAIKGTGAKLRLGHFPWNGESPREMLSSDGTHSLFVVCNLPDQTAGNRNYNFISRFYSTSTSPRNRRPQVYLRKTTGDLVSDAEVNSSKATVSGSVAQSAQLVTSIVNPSGTTKAEKHSVYIDGAHNAEQPYGTTWTPDGNTTLSEQSVLFGRGETTVNTYISEVVYYPSAQSANRAGIEANILNYYNI